MADVNANIGVNIDTSAALSQLKSLQRQISQFHSSIAKSSETAALAQRDLQRNFLNSVNALGTFSAELRNVKTTSESFTNSLEKNKFSMREYFRYAGASTKTFGKLFKSEYDTIGRVAEDRVKKLQTQYIKMGRDATGAMKAIAIIPNELDMSNFSTQTQLAAQKQALFNQLMKQGSTNLLNFGKNTQWAGRQLMVGFTLPLMAVGSAASKTFMDMETQALKFRKVYGDLFTPQAETEDALKNIQALGREFTKYGIAVSSTVGLAAEAAAAGFQGVDLQRQTTEATRLSVLGQIDAQQALQTTIALQNAFKTSSAELADQINFLNAVENQTVTSLDDITVAIPKVAPVIQQLGGDVKDLAFFITAMKEGGINASEGANALKSGLASLINPTNRARDMLQGLGIDIVNIVNKNKGDLKATVIGFAQALDTLAPLERAQAIEQMFGKFQFARLSALFSNVTRDGTQAARVLDLAGASIQDLANLSESELGKTADSAMMKFKKSVEDLKVAIIPVGEAFLKAVTPIIEMVSKIAEKFADLSDRTKKTITILVTVIGGLGPVLLMTFGLLANGIANIIKLFLTLRNGYQRLTGNSQYLGEQTQYLTSEQIEAAAAAHSLNQAHATLTQQFTVENTELQKLIATYQAATNAAARFAATNPGMMIPPRGGKKAKGFANGGIIRGPGTGKSDSIPIMASNGEAIISADTVSNNEQAINNLIKTGKFISKTDITGAPGNAARSSFSYSGVNRLLRGEGLPGATVGVPGNMPSPQIKGFKNATIYLQEAINTAMGGSGQGAKMSDVLGSLKQSGGAAASPLLAVIAGDIKKGLNDPKNYADYSLIGDKLINSAINALETSGKKFVKDIDLEEIVVPAMKNAAKELSVSGVAIKDALDRAINEIKTVAPIGVASGTQGGQGRTNFPGSYRAAGETAQRFAISKNPNVFEKRTVASQSRGQKKVFKMRDVENNQYVTATMAHIMPSINTSISEIEKRVSSYVPDVAKRLQKVGEEAGKKVGKSTVDGVAKGAKTSSPSKETIKTGQDIGKGLEIGMQSRQDDINRVGNSLGQGATQSVTRGSRRVSRAQGAPNALPMSELSAELTSTPRTAEQVNKFSQAIKNANPRLDKMNGAIQGGSFALMSLSGVAQMFGGRLGAISNIIFNLSGALFALQTITQLVTKAKALELLQSKIAAGKQAMAFATYGTGLGAKSGLLGSLARVGIGITKFLGPIGVATTVVTGLVVGFKLLSDAKNREIQAIEGLGNAAQLTDAKLKALGGVFGVVATKSAFERGTTAKQGEVQVASQTRSQLEILKQDKGFQDAFAKDINALKGATDNQAKLIFDSLAIDLKGKGYAAEQIQTIITALQEEAGKTNFKFDVKSIDVSTKEGQARMAQNVKKLTNSLSKNLTDGLSTVYRQVYDPKQQKWIVEPFTQLSKGAKKNLNLVSKSITSMFAGLSGQLESGVISAEQFNSSFENISKTISAMPKAQALVLMESLLKSLPAKLRESANGIGNVSNQLLLLKAQAAGVAVTAEIITAMLTVEKASGPNAGGRIARAKGDIKEFEEKIKTAAEAYKKLTAAFTDGTVTGKDQGGDNARKLSAAAKLNIARLQKELDLLKTKRDKVNETNDALKRQYEYQQKLTDLQKSAVEAKIRGDYIGAAMFGQARSFETQQFARETESIALDKRITNLSNRISALQANARLTKAEQAYAKSKVVKKAMGGLIKGPGTGRSDSILAGFSYGGLPQLAVSNGEYIVQSSAVQKYGVGFMDAINSKNVGVTNNSSGSTVYNVNMTVNGGNANANDIADQVIKKINLVAQKNNKSNMVGR